MSRRLQGIRFAGAGRPVPRFVVCGQPARNAAAASVLIGSPARILSTVAAATTVSVLASAGSMKGVTFDPPEWNFGVRPRNHSVTKVVRLRPVAGTGLRVVRVRSSCECLTPTVLRDQGTSDAPAEIKLVLETEDLGGPVDWLVFVSLAEPEGTVAQYRVSGWVMRHEGPAQADVFYMDGEDSAERFLAWWRSAQEKGEGAARVRSLSVAKVENYRRLRDLERKANLTGPPPDIIALVDGDIVLRGEQEVLSGLTGFLNLDSDGRPKPAGERHHTASPSAPHGGASRALGTSDLPAPRSDEEAPPGSLEVWVFYFANCRGCRRALDAVQRIREEIGERVKLRAFDAAREPESVPRAFAIADMYPQAPTVLPSMVAFVGDELLPGADRIEADIGELVRRQISRGGEHLLVRRVKRDDTTFFVERVRELGVMPIVLAGIVDGVNPCAFAAMVLLVSILSVGEFASKGRRASPRGLLLGGGSFCVGVFATYYLAGLALFIGITQARAYPMVEVTVFWTVWVLALVGGIVSAADAVVYLRTGDPERVRLKVPESLRRLFAPLLRTRFRRFGLVLGGLAGGVLIALLEGVCTGQMYLPTIQYMVQTPGLRTRGATYLLVYNTLFVVPLLAILGVALAGVHFHRLNAFLQRHLGAAKLGLAAVFFLLAAVMFVSR